MSDTNYEILAQRSKKVIYKDGDTVLKVFDNDYSKADILNEALNQARIEETGLNVPKLLEVSKIDGKWAIRTEYIPGKTLAQLMEENPDKTAEYDMTALYDGVAPQRSKVQIYEGIKSIQPILIGSEDNR